jgi:mono/diheme cytochrome c family protein
MLRQFFILYFFLLVLVLTGMGLRGCKSDRLPVELFPDMDRQNRLHPQGTSSFFTDGRSDRPAVPGTVPTVDVLGETYSHLLPPNPFYEDGYFATGRPEGAAEGFGNGLPIPVTYESFDRGQELYDRFCTICHGRTGDGNGVLKDPRYGYGTISSLLQQRIMDQPDGEIYNTITWGKNTMMPYGSKLRPEERWQVVLYVRGLQRAASGTVEDVPTQHRGELGL